MPVPHLEIRIVQRSKGSSAVAGAAYQAGEKLFSEYDQKSKDHRRKQPEVLYTEIMFPANVCVMRVVTNDNATVDTPTYNILDCIR